MRRTSLALVRQRSCHVGPEWLGQTPSCIAGAPGAIGYVARIIECVFIAAGITFVLGVVSLRQDSSDVADLAVSLAALKD